MKGAQYIVLGAFCFFSYLSLGLGRQHVNTERRALVDCGLS